MNKIKMIINLIKTTTKYKVIAISVAVATTVTMCGTVYMVYKNTHKDIPKIVEGFNSETGDLVNIDTDTYNDVTEEFEDMEGTFYIKEDQTRIRKANNINSAELIVLNTNDKLKVTGKNSDMSWYRIDWEGKEGYIQVDKVSDKPIEDPKATETTASQETPTQNSSNNVGASSSSNNSNTESKTPPPPVAPPVAQTYTEGIDNDFTNTINTYLAKPNTIYKGVKTSDFQNLTYSVAIGGTSIQNAINQVSNMTWEENGQTMGMGEEAVNLKVTTYNVVVNQYNITNQTAMNFVSNNGSKSLTGEYNYMFAYRHTDGSLTITTLSCSFREQYI